MERYPCPPFLRKLTCILTLAMLVLTAPHPAHAEFLTLTAARDNTLIQVRSAGEQQMSNGRGPNLFVGRNNSGDGISLRRGLIWFDLAGLIPEGSTITSVSLTMQLTNGNSPDVIQLWRLLTDWGEGASFAAGGGGAPAQPPDATWFFNRFDTSRWSTPGGDFAALPSASTAVSGIGLYTWNSTPSLVADAQRWLEDSTSNFGWLLLGQEAGSGVVHGFATREAGPGFAPPRLTVEYEPAVPEPASVVLFSMGTLLAVGGWWRRRRVTHPSAVPS